MYQTSLIKTTTIKLATQKKDAFISAISDINSKIKNGQLVKQVARIVFIKSLIFQRFDFLNHVCS